MSKITNITMAAAILASTVIGGAVSASASDFYGMDASPYSGGGSTMSSSAGHVMGAPRANSMSRTDSIRTGSITAKEHSKTMRAYPYNHQHRRAH
ncbi:MULTISPECIES: hypothetical protein [unclassified Sinorhizobium]|uniref:hypothetical protein n=1 Tax=unclassified Sinorhizobium TaxID=2613772 RepID=UPI003525323A